MTRSPRALVRRVARERADIAFDEALADQARDESSVFAVNSTPECMADWNAVEDALGRRTTDAEERAFDVAFNERILERLALRR